MIQSIHKEVQEENISGAYEEIKLEETLRCVNVWDSVPEWVQNHSNM